MDEYTVVDRARPMPRKPDSLEAKRPRLPKRWWLDESLYPSVFKTLEDWVANQVNPEPRIRLVKFLAETARRKNLGSQRELCRLAGIGQPSLNAYWTAQVDVMGIATEMIQKLAHVAGWTEESLRAYLQGREVQEPDNPESFLRMAQTMPIEVVMEAMKIIVGRVTTPGSQTWQPHPTDSLVAPPVPKKHNGPIISWLKDRQEQLDMDDAEFLQYCEVKNLTKTDLDELYRGEYIPTHRLAYLQRVLGIKTFDEMLELRDDHDSAPIPPETQEEQGQSQSRLKVA